MGIAERIGAELSIAGLSVRVFAASSPPHAEDVAGFDAFVVGSAVYLGHWLKDATTFVHRHQPALLEHPVWLFSSGPLGVPTDAPDGTGLMDGTGSLDGMDSLDDTDPLDSSVPVEIAGFTNLVRPVQHKVFYGANDPAILGLGHRVIRKFPGVAEKIPAGDFRDWAEIEAWAREIAKTLLKSDRQLGGQPMAPSQPR